MQRGGRAITNYARFLTTIIVALCGWWIVGAIGWVNPLFLPPLGSIWKAFASLLFSQGLYIDIVSTIYRAVLGLAISALFAVPLGLVFGRYPKLYEFVELPVDFFRSIPSSSLFFLFILLFGIGDLSKVAVVFYGCSLVLLVNTVYGAKPTREKQDRINMLRSFGASPWQVFYLSVFRDALPNVMAGIRVCISLSLVLVIVTEMFLGATSGLGRQIYDFYLAYRIPEMYVVIILLGLIGFSINKLSLVFERQTLFWLPDQN